MRILDLFCGGGGFSLGFQQAGYRVIGAFDNWQAAIDTYNANMPHAATRFDLADVPAILKAIESKKFDVIVGGPPCQDFSSAGRREEKDRANLTRAYANIVVGAQPWFFIMENVARSRSSNAWQEAREILLKSGYGLTETVIDASQCGVPQTRKRFFCIGEKGADNGFMDDIIKNALSEKKMTVREYMGKELDINHYYRHPRNYNRRAIFSVDEPSATIRGVSRPVPGGYRGHPLDSAGVDEQLRPLTTMERSRIQTFPKNYRWIGSKTDVEQMIGNAVPVNLALFIARCLLEYIDLSSMAVRKAA